MKKRIRILVPLVGILFAISGNAQVTKIYFTKEDYINDRHERWEGVILKSHEEDVQKMKQCGGYCFETEDKALQRRLSRKVFLVEHNDSLYMNAYLLKDVTKGKHLFPGFVRVRDQDGMVYFEAPEKLKQDNTEMFAAVFLLGAVGGAIVASENKKKMEKLSIVYYCYDSAADEVTLMTMEQLTDILEANDSELYTLYKREPLPETAEVIALYARAFFVKRDGEVGKKTGN